MGSRMGEWLACFAVVGASAAQKLRQAQLESNRTDADHPLHSGSQRVQQQKASAAVSTSGVGSKQPLASEAVQKPLASAVVPSPTSTASGNTDVIAADNAQLLVPTSASSAGESQLGTATIDQISSKVTRHHKLGGIGGCCAAICVLALAYWGNGGRLQMLLELTGVALGWCCLLATNHSNARIL